MCLHPGPVDPVPEETARVARAAFPKGTTYMTMRDELGAIFEDEDFARLFPSRGQPAMALWRLALVTVMQFAEGLSDRQAAEAVRARIDCKYALSLELDDPGSDASVLCEFRTRLLESGAEKLLFDHLLERFREMGLVRARGKQRTDSTRILAAVRGLNRLELVRVKTPNRIFCTVGKDLYLRPRNDAQGTNTWFRGPASGPAKKGRPAPDASTRGWSARDPSAYGRPARRQPNGVAPWARRKVLAK